MCGRFALSQTPAALAKVFGTHNAVPNFQPNWNLPLNRAGFAGGSNS
jgi:putative SOS response-associated peptidase YedK